MSPVDFAAGLSALVWLVLCFARGGFWRVREPPARHLSPPALPRVAIVVPARDESALVASAIRSLSGQDYAGPFHIFLVDDQSSDGTAERAKAAAGPARLTVVTAAPRPAGWTGKVW